MTTETLPATTAPAPTTRRRKPRGQYPKKAQQQAEALGKKLPEYLGPRGPGNYQSIRRPQGTADDDGTVESRSASVGGPGT